MDKGDRWIAALGMEKHPEGGHYRENYRSNELFDKTALPQRFEVSHCFSTAIYFLLKSGNFSAFHRIRQDELWHHYDGGCLLVHIIAPNGVYSQLKIGKDFEAGERPQGVVFAGSYFAAELSAGNPFTLVGCTVAPGFDFSDLDMPPRELLVSKFPEHKELVTRLSHRTDT